MSGMACAERLGRWFKRSLVHAKKEKQGCGVCGAPTSPLRESGGTRQKRKARLWRVRSGHFAVAKGRWYTPKKKSKVVACAERPLRRCERAAVHAKKKKQGCGVCGTACSLVQEKSGTRQKGKARLWRVRNGSLTSSREVWHTPKRKSKVVACAERLAH